MNLFFYMGQAHNRKLTNRPLVLLNLDFFLGWYEAEVQSCDLNNDEVDLVFIEGPGCVCKIPVIPNLVSRKLSIKRNGLTTVPVER